MPQYKCRRCGYTSNLKANIRRHFMKKNICSPVSSDLDIASFYEEVLGEKYPNALGCVGNALEN